MPNTLILEGGQGSNIINDTAVHSNLSVGQIVILEDGTEFGSAFKSTLQKNGEFSVGADVVASGDDPGLGAGHQKGEYISMISGQEKITAITLVSGSIRIYNF